MELICSQLLSERLLQAASLLARETATSPYSSQSRENEPAMSHLNKFLIL